MASVPSVTGSTPNDIAAAITADVQAGTLPQVSWVVANQAFSEHPYAPPGDGAHFIDQILTALSASSAVLDSTVMFLNYDENDGFFDHVPPPVAPAGTTAEFYDGTNIGLGFRVPMVIISPWTRGGWVDSQTFDHTSVIRFLETWTGCPRHARHLRQHQCLAPAGLRRPHQRLRLRQPGVRAALAPVHHHHHRVRYLHAAAQPESHHECPACPGDR